MSRVLVKPSDNDVILRTVRDVLASLPTAPAREGKPPETKLDPQLDQAQDGTADHVHRRVVGPVRRDRDVPRVHRNDDVAVTGLDGGEPRPVGEPHERHVP